MKKLTIWTQKGGVGKTAVVCQLAHYLHARGYRVLVADFDGQGNASQSLLRAEKAVALNISAAALMMNGSPPIAFPDTGLAVVPAVSELALIPERPTEFNRYFENLRSNLERIAPHFDICIIDCPPSDDLRVLLALTVSGAVLSPVHLLQESIEGIHKTLRGRRGIDRIREKLNPSLQLLGILPAMVEATPLQKRNFVDVMKSFGQSLVQGSDGGVLRILRRSAIAEAQELGLPLAELARGKTSAREAWAELQPVLERIVELLELPAPKTGQSSQLAAQVEEVSRGA